MQTDTENRIQQAESSLKRMLDWIGRHDARIAFAAGLSIAMLGVLAHASAAIAVWTSFLFVVFGFSALLLFVSLGLLYFSQYPKTDSRNSSLIFFGTIANLKSDEFQKKFKAQSREDYLDDLLCQIHINAEILDGKFTHLKYSLILLATSLIPWLTAIYFSRLYIK